MARLRLDKLLADLALINSRSQALNLVKLGRVKVNNRVVTKAGLIVDSNDKIELNTDELYVSRAGLKLASVAGKLHLDFRGRIVLDVGSSTGGFTDFALQHGASRVIAVDVGTDQLHPSLRGNSKIELHEQTDIRGFKTAQKIDLVVIDVSFISLREILPSVTKLVSKDAQIVAMVKPQFEAGNSSLKHNGVIKNERMRRQIIRDFEIYAKKKFLILGEADSLVAGEKGNLERFYLLKVLP